MNRTLNCETFWRAYLFDASHDGCLQLSCVIRKRPNFKMCLSFTLHESCLLNAMENLPSKPRVALGAEGTKEGWQAGLEGLKRLLETGDLKGLAKLIGAFGRGAQWQVAIQVWQTLLRLRWSLTCFASVPASQPVERASSGSARLNCCRIWKQRRLFQMQ